MSRRGRITGFGTAFALVVGGAACAAAIGGGTGQILAFVLIATGLVTATGLVFLEVGLSEDRERERDRERASRRRPLRKRAVRRPALGRERGQRRRLR